MAIHVQNDQELAGRRPQSRPDQSGPIGGFRRCEGRKISQSILGARGPHLALRESVVATARNDHFDRREAHFFLEDPPIFGDCIASESRPRRFW